MQHVPTMGHVLTFHFFSFWLINEKIVYVLFIKQDQIFVPAICKIIVKNRKEKCFEP